MDFMIRSLLFYLVFVIVFEYLAKRYIDSINERDMEEEVQAQIARKNFSIQLILSLHLEIWKSLYT